MWGDKPLPEVPDTDCANCKQRIYFRFENEDGDGVWVHSRTRSIRCELFAEPA